MGCSGLWRPKVGAPSRLYYTRPPFQEGMQEYNAEQRCDSGCLPVQVYKNNRLPVGAAVGVPPGAVVLAAGLLYLAHLKGKRTARCACLPYPSLRNPVLTQAGADKARVWTVLVKGHRRTMPVLAIGVLSTSWHTGRRPQPSRPGFLQHASGVLMVKF